MSSTDRAESGDLRGWVYQAEPGRWVWLVMVNGHDRPYSYAADFTTADGALEDMRRMFPRLEPTIDPFFYVRQRMAAL